MKKIYSFIVFIIISVSAGPSFAHVFPTAYPGYPKYQIPEHEYYYVRIIPSPILEGFASYELCPLIHGKNMNRFLTYDEKQKLNSGSYHHDLINPYCERPYQIDPMSDPVYFDLRDLDRILSHDDEAVKAKLIGEVTVGAVAFYFTAGAISPALVGWLAGGVTSYAATEATTIALDVAYPISQNRLSQTQIKYFTGTQAAEGTDLYWPILPTEIQTAGECYQACSIERKKRDFEIEQENKKNPLFVEKYISMPSETTNSMNPLNNIDECAYRCSRSPEIRTSMRKVWKDLYLDTIYQTGHEPYRDQYPNHNDQELNSKQLYERYHTQKHLDWSAWTMAMETKGKKIPNHYTHKGNVDSQIIFGGHDIHFLCDFVRTTAFENYKKINPHVTFRQWFDNKCHFDKKTQCREYFDGPVQTGNEICTVLSE